MALPFLNRQSKKRDQIIAIDLGVRSTKAVHMQRKGGAYTMLRYCVMDAPIFEKTLSVEMLAEHLKAVQLALESKTKFATFAIGVQDSIVRQAELPQIPVDDLRQILKMNSKNYLQQELNGYTYDCHFPTSQLTAKKEGDGKAFNGAPQKLKVLVGGAKRQFTDDIQTAARLAGLVADQVVPGIVGPCNAFETAMPECFGKEAVALVDVGFKATSICILQKGELAFTRVLDIGGDRITKGLAEAMNISYAEAEGIKIGMPAEVKANLEPLLRPLGRELRASIDFFEHQHDKVVSQVYMCGGSARSEYILKSLEQEMSIPCVAWNPALNIQLALPGTQMAEIEQVAPQLTVAIGSAAVAI